MKVIVWSKHNCPFCVRAKHALTEKGLEYEERIIGEDWSKEQLLEMVPDARSVPQIIIDEKVIGGYTEMVKYLNTLDIPDTFLKRN
jgi:glutaredoxin